LWGIIEERVQTTARSTTGRLNAQYVWSPVSVDALIERDRDSNGDAILDERVYALQDANWNVTALVAGPGVAGYAVGAIINRFAYSPYGTTQVMTPSWTAASSTAIPWKHTFQGLAANTSTGLYDARNRDYSPILGRFIEPDPIGFQAGDNNFYRFVGNGPVGRNDPMGLITISVGGNLDLHLGVVHIGFGADVNIGLWYGIPMDLSGSVTAGGGPGIGAGAGAGGHATITNAADVDQLHGPGTNYGFNCPVGGIGIVTGHQGDFAPVYTGITLSAGPTAGGGIELDNTDTASVGSRVFPWHPDAEWWFGLPNPFRRQRPSR